MRRERQKSRGRTRSLWPSSIRIPRISVNGPLLPRPFGQCTVWVVDMSPQIPHILRRMGRWRCRAQPTGIRLVTATRYGPRSFAFLSFFLVSPFASSLPLPIFLPPRLWKAPPQRRAQREWPRFLYQRLYASIDTYIYLFAQERRYSYSFRYMFNRGWINGCREIKDKLSSKSRQKD